MGVIATSESSRKLPEFSIPAQVANALMHWAFALPRDSRMPFWMEAEWNREPSPAHTGRPWFQPDLERVIQGRTQLSTSYAYLQL